MLVAGSARLSAARRAAVVAAPGRSGARLALAAAVVLYLLAACEPEQADRAVVTDTRPVDQRVAEGAGPLHGELVAVAALTDGGNQVWVVDVESGVGQPLFTTDPSYSMSEWRVAASGDEVVYRLSHPLKEVRERLVVQELAVGAEPTEVASSGPDEARLAGAAWNTPGLVYGLQSGLGVEEGASPAWSLMRWDGRRARTMWQLEPEPESPRQLAGWDPEGAIATVLDLPEQGGPARGLSYLSDGSEVASVAMSIPSSGAAVSHDGKRAAVIDAKTGDLALIVAPTGERKPGGGGSRGMAEGPVWSADDTALAWTETGAGGERWARLWRLAGSGGGGAESVRMAKDARVLAVADGDLAAVSGDGMQLLVRQAEDSDWRTLGWEPPGTVWRVDWTLRTD